MTTEEFTGHLMAALHGPQAPEIVARISEVLVSTPVPPNVSVAVTEKIDKTFGLTDTFMQLMAVTLAVLANENAKRFRSRSDMKSISEAVEAHAVAVKQLRSSSREWLESQAKGTLAKMPAHVRAVFED